MIDEGVVKYSCEWVLGERVALESIKSLIQWRNHIHKLGLIGVYDNGIGFGNISIRIPNTLQFYWGTINNNSSSNSSLITNLTPQG